MKNSEKATAILQSIAEKFSEKEFPETCAKAFINATEIPSASWSLGNQVAMFLAKTTDARGYRQWEQAKRYVKKGSKAIYILVPMLKKIKDKDQDKTIIIGFRGMPVFRYEDTDGAPLDVYAPKVLPPLFGLAAKNGIDVTWINSKMGEYGSINPQSKEITLSTEAPDTFLHEMVHWYDNKTTKLKTEQDPEQETVAQLGACVLAKMYGYDSESYTWNYIASYVKAESAQDVGQMCFRVLGRVQKIITAILDDAESISVKDVAKPETMDIVPALEHSLIHDCQKARPTQGGKLQDNYITSKQHIGI